MVLTPEKTLEVFRNQAGTNLRWSDEIETKVRAKTQERATCPASFAEWVVACRLLEFTDVIEKWRWQKKLASALENSECFPLLETTRTRQHKILFIESEKTIAQQFYENVRHDGFSLYKVPKENVSVTFRAQPPLEQEEFHSMLQAHTSSILHNMDPRQMINLRNILSANPELAPRIVFVKPGGSFTDEHIKLYAELTQLGVEIIEKPYPSIDELIALALGLV